MFNFIKYLLILFFPYGAFAQTTGALPPIRVPQPGTIKKQPSPKTEQNSSRNTNDQTKFFDAKALVNDGWQHFSGLNGVVDEKKGMDYTIAAIKILDPDKEKNALSVAKNNLAVMYLCAINPSVRNVKAGLSYLQDFNDYFSIDNLIWSVFLRRETIENQAKLFEYTKAAFPNHPVNKYIENLDGKLPENMDSAYKFLESMSELGDPFAAIRIGFKYECGFEHIDIDEAIRWYILSKDLHAKKGSPTSTLNNITNRINRLNLIKIGQFKH